MSDLVLTLYVTGRTSRAERAIANLHHVAQSQVLSPCQVSVIDVLEQPELAEQNKIIATPTLIKSSPAPARRIVGDLSDVDEVALRLGIRPDVRLDRDKGADNA